MCKLFHYLSQNCIFYQYFKLLFQALKYTNKKICQINPRIYDICDYIWTHLFFLLRILCFVESEIDILFQMARLICNEHNYMRKCNFNPQMNAGVVYMLGLESWRLADALSRSWKIDVDESFEILELARKESFSEREYIDRRRRGLAVSVEAKYARERAAVG